MLSTLLLILSYCLSGAWRRDSISPILRSLHWLTVWRRVTFKSAVIVWKCVNGVAPTYLRELCVPMEDVRSRPRLQSASTCCILLPRVQTSTGQRSFAYSGPAMWNSLPPALRENMSLATFKTKLKTYLFRRSQWLSKTTRRCCRGFAISVPWYKWLYLLTYLSLNGNWLFQLFQPIELAHHYYFSHPLICNW